MTLKNRTSHAATFAFVHDLIMTAAAFVLALYLRVGDAAFGYFFPAVIDGLPIVLAIAAITFRVFGLYRSMWRFVSLSDLIQIIKAATITILAFLLAMFLLTRLDAVPRSHPLIMWFVLIALIGAPRLAYRMFIERGLDLSRIRPDKDAVPVLLVGAGASTDAFLRWLAREERASYQVVGIIATRADQVGRIMHGIPVLGEIKDLDAFAKKLDSRNHPPQRVILPDDTSELDSNSMRALFGWSDDLGMTLCRLPKPVDFKNAHPDQRLDVRPIDVADLLHRPQTKLDEGALGEMILGKCVVITGAGGTIGGELSRQVAAYGPRELLLIDHSEFNLYKIDADLAREHPMVSRRAILCNIRSAERVQEIFATHSPDLVFHAAALKHVPLVEANPAEAILTNCVGSSIVADAAVAAGAKAMVLISTDKAVAPSSVMGATKRITERYCQALDWAGRNTRSGDQAQTQFITVRFGNVLGSSGSVVPLFQEQLAQGGPITVTDPNTTRYFMTAREAVQLVLQASAHATSNDEERGRILVLEMGEPVNIVDLARQMIRLQGLKPGEDIQISFTGLRPGEKLHESLVDEDEEAVPTSCDGVMAINPAIADLEMIRQRIDDLRKASVAKDFKEMERLIRTLVPNYSGSMATDDAPGKTPETEKSTTVRLVGS